MTAHQLNQSQRTEKSSKSGFHRVYLDDCDRGLPSLQSKMGATSCGRPFPPFSKLFFVLRATRWLRLPDEARNNCTRKVIFQKDRQWRLKLQPSRRSIGCRRRRFDRFESATMM